VPHFLRLPLFDRGGRFYEESPSPDESQEAGNLAEVINCLERFIKFYNLLRAMETLISGRDFLQVRDAARLLGVSEQTLRNWDKAGRLRAHRHPISGYRLYRSKDLHALLSQLPGTAYEGHGTSADQLTLFTDASQPEQIPPDVVSSMLPPCHWSPEVALDPRHRPQRWNSPATTVRRDWRKFPQEAHVLDATEKKYRRFRCEEVALLQGFNADVVSDADLTEREKIAALGDAVPPPLARALVNGIANEYSFINRTAIEICAGIGGLAEGVVSANLEHLLLVDSSEICGRLLQNDRPWPPNLVTICDIRKFDFSSFREKVGLLSGGPPCQPWSHGGLHVGAEDSRDLLGGIDRLVRMIKPEVFLFENVPGLATFDDGKYIDQLVRRLRRPDAKLQYSVLAAMFNAADFGVPQIRHRIFILGIRDMSTSLVSRCFDRVASAASNRDRTLGGSSLPPWKTVGEALGHLQDSGGWRRWIGGD
jgi:excisionase family DNA binding protein